MPDWPSRRIGELAEWHGGMTPSMANPAFWRHGAVPWISSKEVVGGVLSGTERKVNSLAIQQTSLRLVPAGSVVVVVRSGILLHTLPVALVPFASTVNQDIKIGTPRDDVLPQFLAFTLQAHADDILKRFRKTGTTVQSIDVPGLMSLQIGLPSLAEQHRIVDLIVALDSQISALRGEAAAAAEFASILRKEQTELARWPQFTLGDVAVWRSGATPKAGTPAYYEGGTVPWAVIGDVRDARIRTTRARLTPEGASVVGRLAPVGSVLVTMYGTIGRVALTEVELATNQAIAWAEPDHEIVTSEYLFHWLRGQKDVLDAQGRGATQRNINREIVRKQPILVPPIEEQRRIVHLLDAAQAVTDTLVAEMETARSVRAALLPALLSAKIEIPDSYDSLLAEAV